MDWETAQLKQLYAELKSIYLEMLNLTRDLQRLCAGNTFPAEDDREKLSTLLLKRGKMMERAAARQKEVGVLAQKLRDSDSLSPVQGDAPLPPEKGFPPWRDQFSAAPRRLGALVEEIIALDSVTIQTLRHSLHHAAKEIEKIQRTRKANKAYQGQDYQPEGFFLDSNK